MSTAQTEDPRHLRVFLCHAAEDKSAVRELYRRLRTDGFEPWLNEEQLLPGQNWQREIEKAVRAADVVIVCLSQSSLTKTGFVQKEIGFALDVANQHPEDIIFLLPIKLEECPIPERLNHFHYVKLFEERGYERLTQALHKRAGTLGRTVAPSDDAPTSRRRRPPARPDAARAGGLRLRRRAFRRQAQNPNSELPDLRPSASPFIIGPPVPPERLYGRDDLRRQLRAWLGGAVSQSCMLVGLYRSGKSSLLRYIRERPNEFFRDDQHPLIVALDFADATCRTPDDVLESLRRALAGQLEAEPWPVAENADPHTVKAALERLRDRGRRLVVLIDEFQTITRNAPAFTHWGSDWRSKMQSDCLTCVIASLLPVSEVYRQAGSTSPFGNDLRDATLGALEPDAWQALVRDGMHAAGRPLHASDLELIDELAGGLPFYTQLAGDALLRHADPPTARVAFAAAAAPHFAELWRTLDDRQRHALRFAAGIAHTDAPEPGLRYVLRARGLLRADADRPFSSAFTAFIGDQL